MLLKTNNLKDGSGPREVVVGIVTRDGNEEVIVSKRQVQNNLLAVSGVIGFENSYALVELPRESTTGKWRVWVPQADVVEHT